MKICTISDTHGKHANINTPGSGDLIIHAGDMTPRGYREDVEEFLRWYADLDFDEKILIAGNHDWDFEKTDNSYYVKRCKDYGITYLNDSGTTYKGLKIWGSPITPEFNNWAFNRTIDNIGEHWDLIPNNTDILVTHGPPYDILDECIDLFTGNVRDKAGCMQLLDKIVQIKPKIHIFGHIHESRGVVVKQFYGVPTTFVNTSCLDTQYLPYEDEQFKFDWNKVILGKSNGKDY